MAKQDLNDAFPLFLPPTFVKKQLSYAAQAF